MARTIDEWAHDVHELAVEKGWWNESGRNFGEIVANIHGEVSESFEKYCNGQPPFYYDEGKPEGWAVELVDVLLRTLDVLGTTAISIESLMEMKHEYNKTRPYRHGNKLA